MKRYGYIRVSTGTQAEKGYGMDAQRDEIEKYAQEQGFTLEAVFVDAGISGNIKDTDDDDAINKREGLIDMLAALDDGDVVIVLNTSRLWRSDMTKALVRRELMKRGAHVVSIEQPKYNLYSKDPSDYLINAIMEALDVYERMSISLKLARGRAIKAKGGDKPAGTAPYGYRYAADKKSIEVNPDEAEGVRFIFSEAAKGASLGAIAEALNSQGKQTRQGNGWQRGSLAAILHNRFYVGELQHQGQAIQGNHTPIISKVQFGKVQAALERRNKR